MYSNTDQCVAYYTQGENPAVPSSVVISGYKNNFETQYHGFTNYSTYKVAQYIFGWEDFQAEMKKPMAERNLQDSITSVLAGIHFNSGKELQDYMMKFQPLDALKPSEYSYVNWREIWEQMGHENEFGLVSDIGLTGSETEQIIKTNPEYMDLVDKLNSEAPVITPEERVKNKIEYARIILNSYLSKLRELGPASQMKERVDEIKGNIKRVVLDLYNTCHRFPITGDQLVDNYLSHCSVK